MDNSKRRKLTLYSLIVGMLMVIAGLFSYGVYALSNLNINTSGRLIYADNKVCYIAGTAGSYDKYYDSLEKALADANSADVICVFRAVGSSLFTKNIVIDKNVTIKAVESDVTVDLGSYNITINSGVAVTLGESDATLTNPKVLTLQGAYSVTIGDDEVLPGSGLITNNGTLTITASSKVVNSYTPGEDEDALNAISILNCGTTNVNGEVVCAGGITILDENATSSGGLNVGENSNISGNMAICMVGAVQKLNVSGGKIAGTSNGIYCFSVQEPTISNAEVTISGSAKISSQTEGSGFGIGIGVNGDINLTIKDTPTIIGGNSMDETSAAVLVSKGENLTMNISGGTFTSFLNIGGVTKECNVTITGGTFNDQITCPFLVGGEITKVKITGGEFKSDVICLEWTGDVVLDISGGVFDKAVGVNALKYDSTREPNKISGGTFKNGVSFYRADAIITGGTFENFVDEEKGTSCAVDCTEGSVTIGSLESNKIKIGTCKTGAGSSYFILDGHSSIEKIELDSDSTSSVVSKSQPIKITDDYVNDQSTVPELDFALRGSLEYIAYYTGTKDADASVFSSKYISANGKYIQTKQFTATILGSGSLSGTTVSYYAKSSDQTKTLDTNAKVGYTHSGYTVAWSDTNHSDTLPTATTTTLSIPAKAYGNVTLTPAWTANKYTVTLKGNGGTPQSQTMQVTYDSAYGTLPTPTRTGYTFNGWYTAPDGYSLIDYVEFNQNEYFDTGSIPNENTIVNVSFYTNTSEKWLFGSRTSTSAQDIYACYVVGANSFWYQIVSQQGTKTVNNYFGKISTLKTTRSNFVLNGSTYGSFGTGTLTSTWPLLIGATNNGDSIDNRLFSGRIYSFQILNGTTMVRDFVPAVRKSDSVIGLYDLVEGKFYTHKTYNASNADTLAKGDTTVETGTKIESTTKVTTAADHALYAKWTANTYTVRYFDNYGDTATPTQTVTYTYDDDSKTFPSGSLTSSGWSFAGWVSASTTLSSDGAKTAGTAVYNLTSTNGAIMNLYSLYKRNVSVEYASGGGSGTMTADKQIQYYNRSGVKTTSPEFTVKANTFTRTGYDFITWTNGSNTYAPSSKITPFTDQNVVTPFTLTASWRAKTYTLTADAQKGTIPATTSWTVASDSKTATKTVTYDSTYGTLPTPARTGYTFGGWYTQANGSGTKIESTTKVQITEDQTIYAKWTANAYTVVYNGNGNTGGSTASSTHTYDVAKNLTANGFTKTGCVFTGWAESASGSKVYDNQQSVTNLATSGEFNLYAVWKNAELYNGKGTDEDNFAYYIMSTLQTKTSNTSLTRANIYSIKFTGTKPSGTNYFNIGGGNTSTTTDAYLAYYTVNSSDSSKYDITIYSTLTNGTVQLPAKSGYMFYKCESLTTLDVSTFSSSKVTDMSCMFYHCSGLTTLDLSGFTTGNVTNMFAMFEGCSSLTTLNLNNFDTSEVTNMRQMFTRCSGLKTLDLSDFTTAKVTEMSFMFSVCSSLTTLNLNNFDTSKVTEMSYMFHYCKSLTTLTINNFDTSKVEGMGNMFENCSSLTTLDLSNFTTTNVKMMHWMFNDCSSLTTLNLSSFDITNVTLYSYMLSGCSKLLTINSPKTLPSSLSGKIALPATYLDSNGTSYTYLPVTTNASITLRRGYTVTYDATTNGGTTANTTRTVAYGASVDLTLTAAKSGWNFVGWNTNKDEKSKLTSISMGTSNITLYAIYSKTITGTFKYYNNQTKTVTSTIYNTATSGSITAPGALGTPDGYKFRHWSTASDANATSSLAASGSVSLTADATYYASYQKNVTGTFYYSQGTISQYVSEMTQTSTTATATQYLGYTGSKVESNFTVPDAVKNSVGSAIAKTYRGVSTSTASVTLVTPTTANTTFYAVYYEDLTFYYYNGSSVTNTKVVRRMLSNGTKYVGSLNQDVPTPSAYDGATFKDWQYQVTYSASSENTYTRSPLSTGVNALYARYTKSITATFNYYSSGAKTATASANRIYICDTSSVKTWNNKITMPSTVSANPTGYTYRGVSTSETANATVLGADNITTANTTYYASYTYKVTLTFNGNGSTGGTAPSNVSGTAYMNYAGTQLGASLTMPTNPFTKTGYSLNSTYAWNSNTSGTGTNYKANTAYTFTASATVYANWTANTYTNTLNYNANNGTGAPSKQTAKVTYPNTSYTFTLSTTQPTRTDYVFAGWYTEASGGTKVTGTYTVGSASTASDQSATIYAHWTAAQVKIGTKYFETLADAVTYANSASGSTLELLVTSLTISSVQTINANMTIKLASGVSSATIKRNVATADFNMFSVSSGKTLTIQGNSSSGLITLDGQGSAGLYSLIANSGTFSASYVKFYNNIAYNTSTTGKPNVRGGAIHGLDNSTTTLDYCILQSNKANYGGAVELEVGAKVTASNSQFTSNTAYKYGGAFYASRSGDSTFTSCTFTSNATGGASGQEGSAVWTQLTNTTFTSCTFTSHSASYYVICIRADYQTSNDQFKVAFNSTTISGDQNIYLSNGTTYTLNKGLTFNGGTYAKVVVAQTASSYAPVYISAQSTISALTFNNASSALQTKAIEFSSSTVYSAMALTIMGNTTVPSGYGLVGNGSTLINCGKQYTNSLVYDANGGSGAPSKQTMTLTYPNTSHTYTLSSTTPTRPGYTFAGWYTEASGGTKVTDTYTVGSASTASNQSATLYAHWTANTYTVVYNGNGNTGGSTASSSHTYDVAKKLTANGFTKTGYVFTGWATTASGSKVYDDQATVTNLATSGTFTLYAVWKNAELYNGSGTSSSQFASYLVSQLRTKTSKTSLAASNISSITFTGTQPSGMTFLCNIGGGTTGSTTDTYLAYYSVNSSNNYDITIYSTLSNGKVQLPKNSGYMFYNCSSLTSLNLSSFNTSNVTYIWYMFSGCSALTTLDLSSFNTSKVTGMTNIFRNCSTLTTLDLSNFDTSMVDGMERVFAGCSALTTLNLSSFDTSRVTSMQEMFYNCSALTTLGLSSFDTSRVSNMCMVFMYCSSLTTLDLSSFDTSSVTNMVQMFSYCSSLTTLNLSSFDMTKVTSYSGMFSICTSLLTINSPKTLPSSLSGKIALPATYLDSNGTSYTYLPVTTNASITLYKRIEVYNVTKGIEYNGTTALQTAINAASAYDVIDIKIDRTENVTISKGIQIKSSTGATLTTSKMTISSGAYATITELTIHETGDGIIINGGSLNLSVTFETEWEGIKLTGSGNLAIQGGSYHCVDKSATLIENYGGGSVDINAGTLYTGYDKSSGQDGSVIVHNAKGTVTVRGGWMRAYYGIFNRSLTLEDGKTIDGTKRCYIYGGTLIGTENAIYNGSYCNTQISGGSITNSSGGKAIYNTNIMTVSGSAIISVSGTLSDTSSFGIYNDGEGTVTVKGTTSSRPVIRPGFSENSGYGIYISSTNTANYPVILEDYVNSMIICICKDTSISVGGLKGVYDGGYDDYSVVRVADNGKGSYKITVYDGNKNPGDYYTTKIWGNYSGMRNSTITDGAGWGKTDEYRYYFKFSCFDCESWIYVWDEKKKKIRRKKAKNITYKDKLLVWNFDKGCFEFANPLFIQNEEKVARYHEITFSDGTKLNIAKEHAVFNVDLGKFCPITSNFAKYGCPIGTKVMKHDGKIVTVTGKRVVEREISYTNIITKYHMNCFVNGILTSTPFNNMYEIKDMKFVKDGRHCENLALLEGIDEEIVKDLRLREIPDKVLLKNSLHTGGCKNMKDYIQSKLANAKPRK